MQKVTGKLVTVLPTTTYGKDNKKKGGIVIETGDKYPKKVAITLFEAKLPSVSGLTVGDEVSVDVVIESHEWQGKWFTDVIGRTITAGKSNSKAPQAETFQVPDTNDSLPF